jgi:hypothetical protein
LVLKYRGQLLDHCVVSGKGGGGGWLWLWFWFWLWLCVVWSKLPPPLTLTPSPPPTHPPPRPVFLTNPLTTALHHPTQPNPHTPCRHSLQAHATLQPPLLCMCHLPSRHVKQHDHLVRFVRLHQLLG